MHRLYIAAQAASGFRGEGTEPQGRSRVHRGHPAQQGARHGDPRARPRARRRSSCRTTRSSSAIPTPACSTAARSPRCSTRAAGAAVFAALTEWVPIATLDLRIDYLRAAEAGRDVIAPRDLLQARRATSRSRARSRTTTIPTDPIASSRRHVHARRRSRASEQASRDARRAARRREAIGRLPGAARCRAVLEVPRAVGALRGRRADHDDALRAIT